MQQSKKRPELFRCGACQKYFKIKLPKVTAVVKKKVIPSEDVNSFMSSLTESQRERMDSQLDIEASLNLDDEDSESGLDADKEGEQEAAASQEEPEQDTTSIDTSPADTSPEEPILVDTIPDEPSPEELAIEESVIAEPEEDALVGLVPEVSAAEETITDPEELYTADTEDDTLLGIDMVGMDADVKDAQDVEDVQEAETADESEIGDLDDLDDDLLADIDMIGVDTDESSENLVAEDTKIADGTELGLEEEQVEEEVEQTPAVEAPSESELEAKVDALVGLDMPEGGESAIIASKVEEPTTDVPSTPVVDTSPTPLADTEPEEGEEELTTDLKIIEDEPAVEEPEPKEVKKIEEVGSGKEDQSPAELGSLTITPDSYGVRYNLDLDVILDNVCVPTSVIQQIQNHLRNGKHILLYGAPGSGKFELLSHISAQICGETVSQDNKAEDNFTVCRPGPSWGVSDLLQGEKKGEVGQLIKSVQICHETADAAQIPHYLIITGLGRKRLDEVLPEINSILKRRGEIPLLSQEENRGKALWIRDEYRILLSLDTYSHKTLLELGEEFAGLFALIEMEQPDQKLEMEFITNMVNESI